MTIFRVYSKVSFVYTKPLLIPLSDGNAFISFSDSFTSFLSSSALPYLYRSPTQLSPVSVDKLYMVYLSGCFLHDVVFLNIGGGMKGVYRRPSPDPSFSTFILYNPVLPKVRSVSADLL